MKEEEDALKKERRFNQTTKRTGNFRNGNSGNRRRNNERITYATGIEKITGATYLEQFRDVLKIERVIKE